MQTVRLFKIGAKIMPYIPFRVVYFLMGVAAWIIFLAVPRIRRNILSNLSHVLPDRTPAQRARVARGIIKNNLCNYVDIMRQGSLTHEEFRSQIKIVGMEIVREAEKRGKGVLAISGHMGSFSFVMQMSSLEQLDFSLVVEPIKPPEMYEFIKDMRQKDSRAKVIPIGGPEVREIFRALKRNETVCLAIDRDVSGDGIPMKFFGATAPIQTGAAEVALRTGAEIVFVLPQRLPNGHHRVEFFPGFSPEASSSDKTEAARQLTARMLCEVEKIIRLAPENWVVLQPIWDNPAG